MPSLIRFLIYCSILFAIGYGVLFSIAKFYKPEPRKIELEISLEKFN